MNEKLIYVGLGVFGILGPIAFPDYVMQMAVLWIMVLMATTWDITGGSQATPDAEEGLRAFLEKRAPKFR